MEAFTFTSEIDNILKEDFLEKESRFFKSWRKYNLSNMNEALVRADSPLPLHLQETQSLLLPH